MDIAVTVYRHRHNHVSVPYVDIGMHEADTGNDWVVRSAVDTAYFLRYGELLKYEQGGQLFEADLMKRRLECSLLVGNRQFFEFELEGHTLITKLLSRPFEAQFSLGCVDELEKGDSVGDWFGAFSQHTWLRRAAEDIYTAVKIPAEETLFIFRAFEWLQKGLEVGWADLGSRVDIPQVNLKRLKKEANSWDAAARHAVVSGNKQRLGESAPSWVNGTLHAIVHARAAVDPAYKEWLGEHDDPYPI